MPIGSFKLNSIARVLSSGATYISATGGTVSYFQSGSNYYKVHSFTTVGNSNFVVTTGGTGVDAELVGGGGGSGSNASGGSSGGSGGGGGGQITTLTNQTVTAQTYTVTVGGGGTAGSSGSTGGTGGSSSVFGTTVVGGGGSPGSSTTTTTAAGAAGGGGGSFYPGGVVKTRGTGTQNGGTAQNGGTGSTQGGGGGGSNAAVGGNSSGGIGGAGGAATVSTFTGSSVSLGGGGGGGAQSSGTNAASGPGRGAQGAYSSTVAFNGNTGTDGIVNIRYLYDPTVLQFVNYITNVQSGTTSITIPTIQANDIVFFFSYGANINTTIPTAIAPSGWTSIANTSVSGTNSIRTQVFYKVMAGTESGTSLTCISGGGGNQHALLVYRPNIAVSVSVTTPSQQSTAVAPTNQTLTMLGQTGPFIGFAVGASYASGPSVSTTTTPTQNINLGNHRIMTFEASNNNITFGDQTVSMTDGGVNSLISFRVNFT